MPIAPLCDIDDCSFSAASSPAPAAAPFAPGSDVSSGESVSLPALLAVAPVACKSAGELGFCQRVRGHRGSNITGDERQVSCWVSQPTCEGSEEIHENINRSSFNVAHTLFHAALHTLWNGR